MRYHVLAADYDGTLAHHGLVDRETVAALECLAATGRKLILVTGRELDELLGVFPQIGVFHLVVAENGGVLYRPDTREIELLCEPPPAALVDLLRRRRVDPLAVGRSIVATVHPNETVVLEAIRDLGLELHVIFNKGAVMVLPTGVNKATGLAVALERLGLSPHNAVAVGDAENDHSMLQFAELGAATANAVPTLKEHADRVLARGHGAGVMELIDELLADDLASRAPRRRSVTLGYAADGASLVMPAAGAHLLVAGASGSGKSQLVAGLLERLGGDGYQWCVVDPEGRYETLADAVMLGGPDAAPADAELASALEPAAACAVLNLVAVALADRPQAFAQIWTQLAELRARAGRPHCIVVDQCHDLLAPGSPAAATAVRTAEGVVCVTAHPEAVAPEVLRAMDWIAATGPSAMEVLGACAAAAGRPVPTGGEAPPEPGEALLWHTRGDAPPVRMRPVQPAATQRRQRRRTAEGALPPARSFFFRGPEGRLNLRAQNLALFLQIAEGVDDATWRFHLRRGDYSEWMLNALGDPDLAAAVREVEKARELDDAASRARVRQAVDARYAIAAEAAS